MITVDVASAFDADAIAEVVNEVWHNQYPEEKKLVLWPPPFFDWQFLKVPPSHPAVCLGARVEGELVGIFCADIWPVLLPNGDTDHVSFLSCVSVKPIRARYHVSAALLQAAQHWSEQHGARQFFGYVNPAESDLAGRRYWTSRKGFHHAFVGGSRQWYLSAPMTDAAPLDTTAGSPPSLTLVAQTLLRDRRDRVARTRAASLVWTEARLVHHLEFDGIASSSAVITDDAYAICSFYALPQKNGASVGYIDFLAASSPQHPLAGQALSDAVWRLRAKGCSRIFSTGEPGNDDKLLQTLGFVPCFPSYAPMVAGWGGALGFDQHTKISAFYR